MIKKDHRHEDLKKDITKCPYCQRAFRTADDLTLHIVTRHTQSGRRVAQVGSDQS